MAIRSPGPTCQVRSVAGSASAPALQRDVVQVVHLLAEPGGGQPLQLTPCRAAAARRRSARWPRRSGTAAWRSGPAGRGAARRSPCGAGSAGGPRWPRRPARARRGPGSRRRTRPRTRGRVWSTTSQVAVQTASRNHRSWVTTTSAPRRAEQVPGQPVDAGHVQVVGRLVEDQQVGRRGPAARPARPGGARRRTSARPAASSPRWPMPRPSRIAADARRRRPTRARRRCPRPARRCRAPRPGRWRRAPGRGSAAAQATRRSRRWVTRPASGSSALVSSRSRVDLPAPLRPTIADPVVVVQPEGHVGEQLTGGAVALADPVQIDDVGHDARLGYPRARHRPVRGAGRRGTPRRRSARPRPARRAAASVARKTQVGPEPETMPASAPASCPALSTSASSGRSDSAAACRSLPSAAPSTSGSRWRSAAISSSGAAQRRRAAAPAVAQPVQLAVDLRGGQAAVGDRHHPVPGGRPGQDRADRLAAAGAERGAAVQQERDVRAERGGDLGQLVAGQPGAPQRVAGHQRGGRVGAAAGQAAGERDRTCAGAAGRTRAPGRARPARGPPGSPGWSRPGPARRRPRPPWSG